MAAIALEEDLEYKADKRLFRDHANFLANDDEIFI